MQRFFLLLFDMKHSLIVGLGLAGLAYAEHLRREGLTFHIIDGGKGGSSQIAAGIYNPTVLKRFTLSWNGSLFHSYAMPFYDQLEKRLDSNFVHPADIHKIFNQDAEHNDWTSASDQKGLDFFLDPTIYSNENPLINSPYGFGRVKSTGRVATKRLIDSYRNSLQLHELTTETFDYDSLQVSKTSVRYKHHEAKHIVFCEGYQMVNNPYFNALPLVGLKGEILIIKAPGLQSKSILKGPIFIAPIGNGLYWTGATFDRVNKSLECTDKGRDWVLDRIRKMISSDFEIVDHITQIRPTVIDRRPLIGSHPIHQNIHLLNGFGARGVLGAPLLSKWLLDHMEQKSALPSEVNLNRFESYFRQSE
jgi:glycine oxidase